MAVPVPPTERRARAQLRRHYEIEKALADRLRRASKEDRPGLYSQVYDELFRRVPELRPAATDEHAVTLQAQALKPFLLPTSVFLEVGAGDCALALHAARTARRVYAVDASSEVTAGLERPANFELIRSGATALELEDGSVDLAYSCHFLEHLHPDDALAHAVEMRRVLRDGGRYLCVTPNRLWGPHDVSRYFDDVPTGLHLREYTHGDLARLLRRAGFRRLGVLRGVGRPPRRVAVWPYRLVEGLFGLLPPAPRRRLMAHSLGRFGQGPFRPLEQVTVIAGVGG